MYYRGNDFNSRSFTVMAVTGSILPELQCNHDHLVCPLQTITCQCVVTGVLQSIFWEINSEIIAVVVHVGQSVIIQALYPTIATGKLVENGVSSNVSFVAELQFGPVTIRCIDDTEQSKNSSYSIFGMFFENFFLLFSLSYKLYISL